MEDNPMEDIPGVEMGDISIPGVDTTIPGVEETPIKTPGVDNLDVDVKVEMPLEDTRTAEPTGVTTSETPGVTIYTKSTYLQDTKEDQTSTKPLGAEGKVPQPSALPPSKQTVYRMYRLRKNRKETTEIAST